jgi:hypothetical protein
MGLITASQWLREKSRFGDWEAMGGLKNSSSWTQWPHQFCWPLQHRYLYRGNRLSHYLHSLSELALASQSHFRHQLERWLEEETEQTLIVVHRCQFMEAGIQAEGAEKVVILDLQVKFPKPRCILCRAIKGLLLPSYVLSSLGSSSFILPFL